MMRLSSRALILSTMAAGLFAAAPAAVADPTDADAAAAQRAAAQRHAAVKDSLQQLQEARNFYSSGKYSEAVESYRNALAVIPKAPATQKQVAFIKESLADALIAKAMDYRKVGRTEEAKQFLMEAIELDPNNKLAKAELDKTLDPERTNPALTPQHVGNVHEVERLLTLAQGYYDLGSYDQALATYQSVLKIDSYNSAARRGMEQCYKRIQSYHESARDAHRAQALAEVDAQYDSRDPDDLIIPPADLEFADALQQEDLLVLEEDRMSAHLDKTIMPKVVLDEATIYDVADMIRARIASAEAEAQNAGVQVPHINVIPYFGKPDSKSHKEMQEKRISLNLENISIKALLDVLVSQLGINYYFDSKGLVLSYSGKDFGPLVDRTFLVPSHFFDPAKEDDFDEDSEGGFGSISTNRVDAKATLEKMGVSFPEGSFVRYYPSRRTMEVRNTAYNLEYIGDLVSIPGSKERAIVLSVIVLEVDEDKLGDLGFDWLLKFHMGDQFYGGGGVEQAASTATGAPIFTGFLGDSGAPVVTEGLRSGVSVLNANNMERLITTGNVGDYAGRDESRSPSVFGVRGVWHSADVTMIMRGLSQQTGADFAQCPRVVFSPEREEQVTFGTVRELYFPVDYEAPQLATASVTLGWETVLEPDPDNPLALVERRRAIVAHGVVVTPAHPSEFQRYGMTEDEMAGIGTIIQVHNATISEDGSIVNLALTTTTNELEGFVNWGTPISVPMYTREEIVTMPITDNPILQPLIKRYRVNTQLSVASGSVIVMGGLKQARAVKYEDKVPVLGDLPFVGRLFRSSGAKTTRKALIYFAKVDVVDPTGRSVKTGDLIKSPGNVLTSE